jgi:hypothetical protein
MCFKELNICSIQLLLSPDCSENKNALFVSRHFYCSEKQENGNQINPEPFAHKKTPN